jgi:uncharacterized membrane protein YhaH (DUF805 family)/glutaredoxin
MTNQTRAPALVQLVFRGEIVSGHAPEDAKRKLAAAVGIAPQQIEEVFSGRRVVLKKGVPADEAAPYLAKLERIGIVARAEPEIDKSTVTAAPPLPAAAVTAPAPTAATLALVEDAPQAVSTAPVEEVVCPKCATRQPKRTLCRSCSTDMPRYAAAQKTLKDEERAARLAALKGATTPAAAAAATGETDYSVEGTSLVGSSFDGRIGRVAYLIGGFAISAICIMVAIAALKSGIWLLLVPLLLGALFVSLRLVVLRCHDIGWSGWWSLVSLVPYAGNLFNLILLIVPGTRGSNDFGRPSRPPGMPAVAASVVALGLAGLLGFAQLNKVMPMLAAYGIQSSHAAGNSLASIDDYDPNSNTVIMYSLTTCGYCEAKRRELDGMGIRYTELFIDGPGNAQEQLSSRLDQAGMPRQSYGTPILEVNGVMLPNNPPMEEIVQHLRARKS